MWSKTKSILSLFIMIFSVTFIVACANENEEEKEMVTITFISDGDQNFPVKEVEINSTLLEAFLPVPTKSGHKFKGWSTHPINYEEQNVGVVIQKNIILYAFFELDNGETPVIGEKVTVNFDSKGGTYVPGKEYNKNSKINRPNQPTKAGYDFDGWYKDASYNDAWNFDNDLITTNITLYAKWEPENTGPTPTTKYEVTFDTQGGSTVAKQSIIEGGKVQKPSNPTKGTDTFGGWYKEPSCTNAWNFDTDKITKATTLYAKWNSNSTPVVPVEPVTGDLFVSPTGNGDGKSQGNPTDIQTAINTIPAGNTIWVLDGTYNQSEEVLIEDSNNGSAGKYKMVKAVNPGKAIFDFVTSRTNDLNTNKQIRGFEVNGDYWYFYGITVRNAADNGMLLSGHYGHVELCLFESNLDTGLQIARQAGDTPENWPTYNKVINCTSRNNADEAGEDADGFAAKLTMGVGNVFDGCISHNNIDDGWDLFTYGERDGKPSKPGQEGEFAGEVTIINCISFRNGKTEAGRTTSNSDGNGFKLGGETVPKAHIVKNSIAFENETHGFTDNKNPGAMILENLTSFNNDQSKTKTKANFKFETGNTTYKNFLSYYSDVDINNQQSDDFTGKMINSTYFLKKAGFGHVIAEKSVTAADNFKNTKNQAGVNITISSSDFVSITSPGKSTSFDVHIEWRKADGSIDTIGFLKYKGSIPNIGANLSS